MNIYELSMLLANFEHRLFLVCSLIWLYTAKSPPQWLSFWDFFSDPNDSPVFIYWKIHYKMITFFLNKIFWGFGYFYPLKNKTCVFCLFVLIGAIILSINIIIIQSSLFCSPLYLILVFKFFLLSHISPFFVLVFIPQKNLRFIFFGASRQFYWNSLQGFFNHVSDPNDSPVSRYKISCIWSDNRLGDNGTSNDSLVVRSDDNFQQNLFPTIAQFTSPKNLVLPIVRFVVRPTGIVRSIVQKNYRPIYRSKKVLVRSIVQIKLSSDLSSK